jgi:D-arabinose 1-dehydrogenase-like Zn-dependent alcohol dehydrogenase
VHVAYLTQYPHRGREIRDIALIEVSLVAAARRDDRVQRAAARRLPDPIFDIVLKGLTIRGSIVGTRQDMAEALDFYARGLIHPTVESATLDDINEVFGRMERGQMDGRVVIDYR